MAKYPRLKRLDTYTLQEARDAFVVAQNGVCAICRRPFSGELPPNLDHCHETSFYRGALCTKCNTSLGWYEKYHAAARDYLRLAKVHQRKPNPLRAISPEVPPDPYLEVGPMESLHEASKRVVKAFGAAKARRSRQTATHTITTPNAA